MEYCNKTVGVDQKAKEAEAIDNMVNEATLCDSLTPTVHKFATLINNGHEITEAAGKSINLLDELAKESQEMGFYNLDFPVVK